MSKLRKGQKVIMWDDILGPFKAVVREMGIEALEDICWTQSKNKIVNKGYVLFPNLTPDDIPQRCGWTDWNYKPLIEMEENE